MRRTRARRSAVLLFVFLVSIALVLPAADAHVKTFNANLTLQYKSSTQTFYGTLGGETYRECKGNRLVTLYDADTNSPVATTTTNANGQYRISLTADGGLYYARVEQDVRGGYGHVHTCGGDQSRTIDTPGQGSSSISAFTTGTQKSGQAAGTEDPMSIYFRWILSLLLGG